MRAIWGAALLALTLGTSNAQAKEADCDTRARIIERQWDAGYKDGLLDQSRALISACDAHTSAHRMYIRASLMLGGEGSRVIAEYRHVAETAPSPQTQLHLAMALMDRPERSKEAAAEEAEALLSPLRGAGDLDAYGLLTLAHAAERQDKDDEATALINDAYAADAGVAAATYIRHQASQGHVDNALAACERALKGRSAAPSACVALWRVDELSDAQRAQRDALAKKIEKMAPRRARAAKEALIWELLAFADDVNKEGFGEEAKAELHANTTGLIAKLNPALSPTDTHGDVSAEFRAQLRQARQAVDMEERITALQALTEGTEGEEARLAWFALYQAYANPVVDDPDKALAALKEVLKVDPEFWGLYAMIGAEMLKTGDYDTLEGILERGFEALAAEPMERQPFADRDPGRDWLSSQWGAMADLYYLRGQLSAARGQYEAATQDFLTAWRVQFVGFEGAEGYRSEIALALAKAYDALERDDEAFEAYLLSASGEGNAAQAAKEALAPRMAARYPGWVDVDAFVAAIGPVQRVDGGTTTDDAHRDDAGEDDGPHPLQGQPLPELQISSLEGEAHQLSDLTGKPMFVTFWATWCAPCMEEMPIVAKLKEGWGDDVEIVALATWDEEDAVKAYVEKANLPFHFAIAPESAGDAFGIKGIPFALVVDAEGTVRHIHEGYSDKTMENLSTELGELLEE